MHSLSRLIQEAIGRPAASREALYRRLLENPTQLLYIDAPGRPESLGPTPRNFSVWAHADPLFGGVWVPVFTSRESVASFVDLQELEPGEDREFYWMEHEAGKVYSLLQTVDRFAGILLEPRGGPGLAVGWPEVNALSEGRLPGEAPFLYDLPRAEFRLPSEAKVRVAEMDEELTGLGGRQALFSDVECRPEDFRSLVGLRLELGPGPAETVWTPCRHFAAALSGWTKRRPTADSMHFLLRCLSAFEMYGDAEALCERLADQGEEVFAWLELSSIYQRTGRPDCCAQLCEKGISKYSKEKGFYLLQARAYAQLDDRAAAQQSARRGLKQFPGDAALLRFL